jgi:formimidoylglutamate deiminase
MSTDDSTLVMPGFANTHSHAFQRLLRGDVQHRDPTSTDSFWTWRDRMYAHANALDLEQLEAAARLTYIECLESGYTAVGEFHYLHHDPRGTPYPDPVATSLAHLNAARQTGIRITLLWCVYARGGFDRPLSHAQRRFATPSLASVEEALDRLAPHVDGLRSRLGLAIHSVRAVPRAWLGPLASLARDRGLPLHVHASEQRREVEDCLSHEGLSPVKLLEAEGVLHPTTTLVHATWLDDADLDALVRSQSVVALCPTTEGDLGDGLPRLRDLHTNGIRLCIGSDSHAVIDPFAELRMAEHLARLTTGERCVLTDASGQVAPALAAIGSGHGYTSLGLDPQGDRVDLDLGARLFTATRDHRATALTSGHPGLVKHVEVLGERVVDEGRHIARPG